MLYNNSTAFRGKLKKNLFSFSLLQSFYLQANLHLHGARLANFVECSNFFSQVMEHLSYPKIIKLQDLRHLPKEGKNMFVFNEVESGIYKILGVHSCVPLFTI
ncbi:hypothetical protein FJSC11DRAFT_3490 [Fischerella thermalis JSC-11]|jgi:hypothetical protein|uniref:Uncharacterized protein n=1 Tax=Fischerella thermalis JSC-11 TaxID=741277 RepID=G6FX91_9CYAN|nr:hypothetical protein FJSC11DRAFT_3490 [Fischerella thermalis JSC-11]